ncbi:hypothetical protein IDM40_00640 [Nocardiopsis sp. HNM0947]|uniref:Aminoacyl-transfer RNA synthetases class-II family profile domain-containing protein n=1 Tax=Nocardiopsis coralli TaxID=2772213 RepID=A0ABR9P056_9ACTN|nr:hypothetical protein [Nocardiopsis coralli]MBE2997213.1 hypothetical protein [Nocardiopsis coralli]
MRVYDGEQLDVLEKIVAGLERIASRFGPTRLNVPPLIPESVLDHTGYPKLFPHLVGGVATPSDRAEHGLMLTSAACHHVYPRIADSMVDESVFHTVDGYCFRNEGEVEPGRLRSFRMYEIVMVGGEEECRSWRDSLLWESQEFLGGFGIDTGSQVASDPFFGRPGRLLTNEQTDKKLKWELLAEVHPGYSQAVASFNHHEVHFGSAFGIRRPNGEYAHSACAAFGLDRLLLAHTRRS